jgi:hypothetical protein
LEFDKDRFAVRGCGRKDVVLYSNQRTFIKPHPNRTDYRQVCYGSIRFHPEMNQNVSAILETAGCFCEVRFSE